MFVLNPDGISKSHLFFALTITTAAAAILFLLSSLFYRSLFKGALVTNILIFLFYASVPIIHNLLVPISKYYFDFTIAGIRILRIKSMLLILVLVTLFLVHRYATKLKSDFFLKLFIFPLLLFFAISLAKRTQTVQKSNSTVEQYNNLNQTFRDTVLKQLPQTTKNKNFPDIYFIILDCYNSQEYYSKMCGFDNTPFLDQLKSRGFHIPVKTHSNYGATLQSLSSILNMNYLPKHIQPTPFEHMWKNNNVSFFLKKLGYKYLDLYRNSLEQCKNNLKCNRSLWQELKHELNLFCFDYYSIGRYFLQAWTPLYQFISFYKESLRQTIKLKLNMLNESTKLQSQKFVYAHFMIPHPPHVFTEDGSPFSPDNSKPELESALYGHVESTKYVNREIIKSIDIILKNSKTPPIIILQGDHGYDYTYGKSNWSKYQILNSYHLPQGGNKKLYPSITPVNSFRIIFNHYFGTKLPLLVDRIATKEN